ncbi:MAG: 1,4-dihydroxy-2-naphthoate polyprenyltransferase [Verrucomicrobia bacterium]|nr:1,4-dihydroxy-2-naphthoate polyprenyltransferase [Verrucomicrobiota bacterium]
MPPAGSLRTWLAATRPKTLPAAVAPVLVGTAFAWHEGRWVPAAALACLAFALLVQIATNFANDYYDFVKGADTADRVGPRRAVASGLIMPAVMRRAMIVTFVAAFLAGLALLPYGGWPLLVIGIASILSGIAYTGGPYPLGYHGLGDLFVFLFFGLVAVGATYFVQAGLPGWKVWVAGAAVGLLAANILVTNNLRDAETDARAGKRTTVVRFGRGFGRAQFAASHLFALVVPLLVFRAGASPWVLLPLLLTPLAWSQTQRIYRETDPARLIALLGEAGRYVALYAGLLAAGLVLDR